MRPTSLFLRSTALTLLCFAPVTQAAYTDVSYGITIYDNSGGGTEYPYRTSVRFLEEQGIMTGYPDGTFRPSQNVTRAELVKILTVAAGVDRDSSVGDCFPDVLREWFAPYVCAAKARGWVAGDPSGKFRPNDPVSFAEMFKMLVTSRGYTVETAVDRGYPTDAWYAPYAETLFRHAILHDAAFNGDKPVLMGTAVTRERVAEFLYKTFLSEKRVSFRAGDRNSCIGLSPDSVTMQQPTSLPFQIVTFAQPNSIYHFTNAFQPYVGISPNDVNVRLTLVGATSTGSIETGVMQTAPVRGAKVLFNVESAGRMYEDLTADGQWEFNTQTCILRQLPTDSQR